MGEEGIYEKLLFDDNMKAAEEDDVGEYFEGDAVEYVDNDEKRIKIGLMQVLFYVFGTIVLLLMGVFGLCLGTMMSNRHEFDWFWIAMIVCFLWTSQLGSALLCETISSLNVSTSPETIDFGGAFACGLITWGFYYTTQLCLSIISEKTPGRRFAAAVYMINGAYVFTIVSGVLFIGFFLISCRRLIFIYGSGGGRVHRIIAYPGRGRIATDIYKALILAIFFIIFPRVRDNLLSVSG